MTGNQDRLLTIAAGVAGALGVALSAVAAHRGIETIQTAATLLLVHAPALLALALFAGRTARLGGLFLFIGVALFAGDMMSRAMLDDRLFAYAAPMGGVLMIVGWLAVAVSGLLRRW
jgi:uncharacterized membrane protein YgdD (TMEM256/DUF423 family)